MTTFLQFMFTKADLEALLRTDPDFCVINVGYDLIDDDGGQKRAALAVTADALASGKPDPLVTRLGCPMPPCRPQ